VIEKYRITTGTTLLFCLLISTLAAAQESPKFITGPAALRQAGIYSLRQFDPSLTGAGVKFTVICRSFTYIGNQPQNDYRPFTGHNSLALGRFNFHDKPDTYAGISPHSTSVCSLLFGQDPNAYYLAAGQFYYEGAAPQGQADIYELVNFLDGYLAGKVPSDADILTVDFGEQVEKYWTRGIESLAQNHGIIIVAGIGNGTDATDPLLYPAAGANAIGVGVVDSVKSAYEIINLENFALPGVKHSSAGPTNDGRCKPDLVAPGNCLAAIADKPQGYETTGDYCSFATPIVAGVAGLLVQKAKQTPGLELADAKEGGNCLIKAVLLNSATKLPFWHKGKLTTADDHMVPLDYLQGAGMVNAVAAYDNLTAGRAVPGKVASLGWDNNLLVRNAPKIYSFSIPEPNNKVITVSLAWNKHYQDAFPFAAEPSKDGNLRLELWAVNPKNPSKSTLVDYSDSPIDNVEHIYFSAVAGLTEYYIVVTNSAGANEQRYGLAWSVGERPSRDSIGWYDLNADGIVDEADVTILLKNLQDSTASQDVYLIGDIDGNGKIDVEDVKKLLERTGSQADWLVSE
jgi:hypothetical protein